jgi:hypothetical protein
MSFSDRLKQGSSALSHVQLASLFCVTRVSYNTVTLYDEK